ncbi:MAG TPA: hypothetical protein GX530_02155 [Corynebacteriales bacterium]|nr:hypothetical protein [Mycobacteriales bacterium]
MAKDTDREVYLPPVAPSRPASDGPNKAVPVRIKDDTDVSYAVPFAELPVVTNPKILAELPQRVDLRDNTSSFNRKWEMTLLDGIVYMRHRETEEDWRQAPMPDGFHDTLIGISLDADRLIGVDEDGWLYTMKKTLGEPEDFRWIRAWGGPGRIFDGFQIANTTPRQWCLSVINSEQDQTYTDADGRVHPVSFAGCTQVLFLVNKGQTIVSCDPWLTRDYSYEIGTPYNCRFQAAALSAGASTSFIINKYGDMYTRLYDYDIAGGDPAQFRYTWVSKPDRKVSTSWREHRVNFRTAPIKLPPPDWQQHPKIPGFITDRISIHSTAPGTENRELRVEGKRDGTTGYWHKMLNDTKWQFVPTGMPLVGTPIENDPTDRSMDTLAAPSPYSYEGVLRGSENVRIMVPHFAYADTTHPVQLTFFDNAQDAASSGPHNVWGNGRVYNTVMHTAYGRLASPLSQRLFSRAFGIDDEPRYYSAALVISDEMLSQKDTDPALEKFLQESIDKDPVIPFYIKVTDTELKLIVPPLPFAAIEFPTLVSELRRI